MPEINVSCLIDDIEPSEVSGSIAERGKNAAAETWSNAREAARSNPLDLIDESEVRDYFRAFGAWEDEEIDGWTTEELSALLLQDAAGELRTLQSLAPGDGVTGVDWDRAMILSNRGEVGGGLYAVAGSELWFSVYAV